MSTVRCIVVHTLQCFTRSCFTNYQWAVCWLHCSTLLGKLGDNLLQSGEGGKGGERWEGEEAGHLVLCLNGILKMEFQNLRNFATSKTNNFFGRGGCLSYWPWVWNPQKEFISTIKHYQNASFANLPSELWHAKIIEVLKHVFQKGGGVTWSTLILVLFWFPDCSFREKFKENGINWEFCEEG